MTKVYVATSQVKAHLVDAMERHTKALKSVGYKRAHLARALEEVTTWENEIKIVVEESGVTTDTFNDWLQDLGWKNEKAFTKETGVKILQYVPEPKEEDPGMSIETTPTKLKLALRLALREYFPQWVSGSVEEQVENFYKTITNHAQEHKIEDVKT